MKTKIALVIAIAVLGTALPYTVQAALQVYDLKADWSDTQNPNRTWSYHDQGFFWLMSSDPFPWVDPILGAVLSRTTAADAVPGVLEVGDIYGHDDPDNASFGPGIRWTAPADGTVDISGAIWNTWDDSWIGDVSWELRHNGSLLVFGNSQGSSRSEPADFSMGWNGPNALLNIPVQAGDQVELSIIVLSDPPGNPFGINFTVTFTPDTVDPVSAIEGLAATVAAMNLQNGIENSLDAKLDSALNALDDVNANDDVAACNALDALMNAVEAQRGNKLTDAQADQLVAAAQDIQAALNCGD